MDTGTPDMCNKLFVILAKKLAHKGSNGQLNLRNMGSPGLFRELINSTQQKKREIPGSKLSEKLGPIAPNQHKSTPTKKTDGPLEGQLNQCFEIIEKTRPNYKRLPYQSDRIKI